MVQDIRVRIQRILRVSFFFSFGKFPEEAKTDASFGTYPIGTIISVRLVLLCNKFHVLSEFFIFAKALHLLHL